MYKAPKSTALACSSHAADVWAFAVLTVELSFGVPLADVAAALQAGPVTATSSVYGMAAADWSGICMDLALQLLPLLPASIADRLMECMNAVPEQRPSFHMLAVELLAAVEGAAEGAQEAVQAPTSSSY
jgi:hypothetical protein